ncbi:hypothetical protein CEXT_127831 [Caerostris extrusa]|uniref:Uncharacterized protein n=1 Tax=Caerostris extrusa TaxID=172846 RepID=A0AAV4RR00_CAEEX|nr:hypothetical protein CEXT_127831 [Caerostris extrusa]
MSRRKKRAPKKKKLFSEAKKQKEHLKRKRIREKLYYYVMGYFDERISVLPTRLSITVLDEKLYAGSMDIFLLNTKSIPLALQEEHFDREKVACHEGRKGHQKRKKLFSEAKKQIEHLKRKRIREKLYYYVMGYFDERISVLPTRLSITVLDEKLYAGSMDILWLLPAKHNETLRYCFALFFLERRIFKGMTCS